MKTTFSLLVCFIFISSCSMFDSGGSRRSGSSGSDTSVDMAQQCGDGETLFYGQCHQNCAVGEVLSYSNGTVSCLPEISDEEDQSALCVPTCNSQQYCNGGLCYFKKDLGEPCSNIAECKSDAELCAMKNNSGVYTCLGKHLAVCSTTATGAADNKCYAQGNYSASCRSNPDTPSTTLPRVCWQGGANDRCNLPTDCPATKPNCVSGHCVANTSGGSCTNGNNASCNGQVVGGVTCASGKCYCKNSACFHQMGAGQSPCDEDNQCKTNCTGTGCSTPVCLATVPRKCSCSSFLDCGATQSCDPNTRLCTNNCTYGAQGQLGSCGANYYCNNGIACVQKCTVVNNCSNTTEYCDNNTGQCKPKLGYNSDCGTAGNPACTACKAGVAQSNATTKCGCSGPSHCTDFNPATPYCYMNEHRCVDKIPLGGQCNTVGECGYDSGQQIMCSQDYLRDASGNTKYCGIPLGGPCNISGAVNDYWCSSGRCYYTAGNVAQAQCRPKNSHDPCGPVSVAGFNVSAFVQCVPTLTCTMFDPNPPANASPISGRDMFEQYRCQ